MPPISRAITASDLKPLARLGYVPKGINEAFRFVTFRELCIDLLPEERRRRYKNLDKCVGLPAFRRLLLGQGPSDEVFRGKLPQVSPELAWFIIRNYLKGFLEPEERQISWLRPEDYADLSRDDRQVDSEVFRMVYERLTPWYSKLTSAATNKQPPRWDDQDLALDALTSLRTDRRLTYPGAHLRRRAGLHPNRNAHPLRAAAVRTI